ncbi:MAG: hypothetical protein PHE78_01340 [Candidatus Gastranaerophilales bacterium]|nr:hypothetical protein [Candidatus Gastranaerophilales bacterium]
MFDILAFLKDIFNPKDDSLVGLHQLHDVKQEKIPVKVQKIKKEIKLSDLMKKTVVEEA